MATSNALGVQLLRVTWCRYRTIAKRRRLNHRASAKNEKRQYREERRRRDMVTWRESDGGIARQQLETTDTVFGGHRCAPSSHRRISRTAKRKALARVEKKHAGGISRWHRGGVIMKRRQGTATNVGNAHRSNN